MSLCDVVKVSWQTFKNEVPSSTAVLIAYSPIKAFSEKASQMSDLVSITTRLIAIPIVYLEIPLILLLRKHYHKAVGNSDTKGNMDTYSQGRIDTHDKLFSIGLTLISNPLVYYFVSGERNALKIAGATLGGMALNALLVKPSLYVMDISKDLMGYQTMAEARIKRGIPKELSKNRCIHSVQEYIRDKSLQFEDWLSHKSATYKKRGLVLLITGSIATSLVYVMNNQIEKYYQPTPTVQVRK